MLLYNIMEGEGIIGRMGGKNLLKKRIIDIFPSDYKDMIYVEPFIGGGSVFFKKEPSKIEVINDIDKEVIDIYKGFKKYNFNDIKNDVDGNYNKELFNDIKESQPKTNYNKFIRSFILFRLSFYGQQKTYGNKKKISLNYNFSDRLKKVKIYNTDYKDIIKKYDSDNTLIYLDPPYEGSNRNHYEHHDFDYKELHNILNNIKGYFVLSINDSSNIRKIFNNFNITSIKTKYVDPLKGSQTRIKNELIITNFFD